MKRTNTGSATSVSGVRAAGEARFTGGKRISSWLTAGAEEKAECSSGEGGEDRDAGAEAGAGCEFKFEKFVEFGACVVGVAPVCVVG